MSFRGCRELVRAPADWDEGDTLTDLEDWTISTRLTPDYVALGLKAPQSIVCQFETFSDAPPRWKSVLTIDYAYDPALMF